ncbi:Fe-S cluster assembly ATPase SufC [Candidatus Peribacteria bacterium RIFCSPLOWO2_01_FULL_51_18]|nr:MAG: Fe-S cluster assembly ATPase SufC [Candidatus Peribacteria bacterium RIFCSPLOWO2_01_FULL_51_18]OGJ68310.1 MAG: Fe-S cluster assembly ATPase SufC [Candidatus Peribacteria bacterium RIFCSPLOWO2_02_FULL_51_10]
MVNRKLLLEIKNLKISANRKIITHGIDLKVKRGEMHVIMGPNGSGKSTLASTLMGHPGYRVEEGKVSFNGKNLFALTPDERAKAGLFLAFQYPKEIAGVPLRSFLFAAYEAQMRVREKNHRKMSPLKFRNLLAETMRSLNMDPALAERPVNIGFSGGEKKKAEILQLKILKPVLALLDETDSGLDIDALKIVAEGIRSLRGPGFSALIVTHYARLLKFLKPDRISVMVRGRIVATGGHTLAEKLEREGYRGYGAEGQMKI